MQVRRATVNRTSWICAILTRQRRNWAFCEAYRLGLLALIPRTTSFRKSWMTMKLLILGTNTNRRTRIFQDLWRRSSKLLHLCFHTQRAARLTRQFIRSMTGRAASLTRAILELLDQKCSSNLPTTKARTVFSSSSANLKLQGRTNR